MRTIALIGAPGSGKSTVGPLLAQRLGLPFVDVDAVIEADQGRLIREIFAEDGEPAFRALEREATVACLAEGGVVSLGGGAPATREIAAALDGVEVVWLAVDARNATRRIGLGEGRPLLSVGGVRATLIKLLNERTPVYAALATHRVDTSDREPDAIVDEAVTLLEGRA
ncbi:MAG: shikimate kinase [Propionibacteriaceae bacterium]|nr:shikimate kinase [Propionibacteriaceae bacterium]